MRILLFTGKGGVGKTTLAAATAARLAARGTKALVVSTDPAHSLADAYGTPLGPEPSEVDTALFAAHVDDPAWLMRTFARWVTDDPSRDFDVETAQGQATRAPITDFFHPIDAQATGRAVASLADSGTGIRDRAT